MTKEENIERLITRLSDLGFQKPDMYNFLEGSMITDSFPYFQRDRIGDDELSCLVNIKREGTSGIYYPDSYQAKLLKTHPVPHDKFGVADTITLERQMKTIEWNRPLRELADDALATAILEKVIKLAESDNAQEADIANRLMLRYWKHTPVEISVNVFKHMTDYVKQAEFTLNNTFSDIHAREAYNLLSGRGVLKFYQKAGEPRRFYNHWNVLNDGKLETLPDYDFMTGLKALPIPEYINGRTGPRMVYDLIRGERIPVHLETNGKTQEIYLEANPRERSLNLYDKTLQKLGIKEWLPKEITGKQLQQPPDKNLKAKKQQGRKRGRSL